MQKNMTEFNDSSSGDEKKELDIIENIEDIENNFISLFMKYFKYTNIKAGDKFESDGIKIMINNIRYWVNLRKPIFCCLPAFPAKSPNLEKVFSESPDFGEYLALKQLYNFAQNVSVFYKYGCKILIIADGRVYGDLIGVIPQNIAIYRNKFRDMIKQNGFDQYINYTNLAMELNGDDDNINDNDLINTFLKQYGNIDLETICQNIKNDTTVQASYFGMWKFLEFDVSPCIDKNKYKSITSVQKHCKKIAKNMMIRSHAYSNLIRDKYPNYIRLSIHGHDNSKKFAVCLFKQLGINYCITPWHNTVCKMLDGRILLLKNNIVQYINYINEQRLNLQIASKLSIYSRSKQIWYADAMIENIEYINKNMMESSEWLIIKYNNGKNMKKIQRFSKCINPINPIDILNDNINITHPIDIKHHKQYMQTAFEFDEWSDESKKEFKIIYKQNKKWCYQEL